MEKKIYQAFTENNITARLSDSGMLILNGTEIFFTAPNVARVGANVLRFTTMLDFLKALNNTGVYFMIPEMMKAIAKSYKSIT